MIRLTGTQALALGRIAEQEKLESRTLILNAYADKMGAVTVSTSVMEPGRVEFNIDPDGRVTKG